MNSIIETLGYGLSRVFNGVTPLLNVLGPLPSLLLWSIFWGVIFLLVFARCSSQSAIRKVKEQIHAAVLESIIFRHDLILSLKAQGRMLCLTGAYLGRTLPPLLIVIPLCLPILGQLNRIYGYSPLALKQPAMLEITLTPSAATQEIGLREDSSLNVDGPLRDIRARKVFFKLVPLQSGTRELVITTNGTDAGKLTLVAGNVTTSKGVSAYSSAHWLTTLLYPHDASIVRDNEKIEEIKLTYPAASYSLLSFSLSWITIFLIVSLAAGFAASKFLKIEV